MSGILHTGGQDPNQDHARLVAILGPTNTGKTYYALDRMLSHRSGMIGFPLRLLARENYDRVVKAKGPDAVALVTGEEKIIPKTAQYFLCTVEAMPVDRRVAFLAIDEIQMCADPDRGHIFTERLLHARGTAETMFMGANTVNGLLRELVPGVEILGRPRLSTLSYTGPKKVTRLPSRSVVVTFSAADVYSIAEMIRRQRGGAAVVLGALSPRTRNAQVELFQSGEVEHLVATDAIGMGLNMDVDHVAFAATRKFDGRVRRELQAAELAQIAGRAGRFMNNGTFGTTAGLPGLDDEMVERLENHQFGRQLGFKWRNSDLNYASIAALTNSLNRAPDIPGLSRAREADDQLALAALAKEPDIINRAVGRDLVELLWSICRVPDFSKIMSDNHAKLLGRIFAYLTDGNERLPTDWMAGHIGQLDRTDGDIETLVQRIAGVRTWTYISYQGNWMDDNQHWQGRTRALEDSLSDALHERLTQRFVDQRTSVLMRRMKDGSALRAAVRDDGEVKVEGHYVGRLEGFRFIADDATDRQELKTMTGAAMRGLREDVEKLLGELEAAEDDALVLDTDGTIRWRDAMAAKLLRGETMLAPGIEPVSSDLLESADRERIRVRVETWLSNTLKLHFGPLMDASGAGLTGPARGVLFQLGEGLGTLPRESASEQIDALEKDDRRALRSLGVRIARSTVFFPKVLKPATMSLRAALWANHNAISPVPDLPPAGRVSVPFDRSTPRGFYDAVGFRPAGTLVLRLDMLERIAEMAYDASSGGPFAINPDLLSLAGCGTEEMDGILRSIGFVKLHPKEAERIRKLRLKAAAEAEAKAAKAAEEAKAAEAAEAVEAAEAAKTDDVKSEETAPTEPETIEATAPVEAEAVVEPAPTEPEPVVEAEPVEAEPVEAKPVEAKPVVEPTPAKAAADASGDKPAEEEVKPEPDLYRRPRRGDRQPGRSAGPAKPAADHADKPNRRPRKRADNDQDRNKQRDDRPRRPKGGKGGNRGKPGKQSFNAGPKKPEIAPEDSPFAKLLELKKKMQSGNGK